MSKNKFAMLLALSTLAGTSAFAGESESKNQEETSKKETCKKKAFFSIKNMLDIFAYGLIAPGMALFYMQYRVQKNLKGDKWHAPFGATITYFGLNLICRIIQFHTCE